MRIRPISWLVRLWFTSDEVFCQNMYSYLYMVVCKPLTEVFCIDFDAFEQVK